MPKNRPMQAIQNWIFDLDDTLYPREKGLMQQIDKRMTEYVAEHLNMDPIAARKLQKDFYHQHGTTLRGLMIEYKIDPQHFLDYVHDIDYSAIGPHPELKSALQRLPGRKFVYTNGSVRHGQKVAIAMGIADSFEGFFDIAAGGYIPKPQTDSYQAFLKKHAVDPQTGLILDDLVRNLIPAAKMGLTTVLVSHDHSIPAGDPHVGDDYRDFIHHQTDDMLAFLQNAVLTLDKK